MLQRLRTCFPLSASHALRIARKVATRTVVLVPLPLRRPSSFVHASLPCSAMLPLLPCFGIVGGTCSSSPRRDSLQGYSLSLLSTIQGLPAHSRHSCSDEVRMASGSTTTGWWRPVAWLFLPALIVGQLESCTSYACAHDAHDHY